MTRCNICEDTFGISHRILSFAPPEGAQQPTKVEGYHVAYLSFTPDWRCNNYRRPKDWESVFYHSPRPRGATPASLSLFLSHPLSSFLIVAQSGFFVGDFFKLRKFFVFLTPRPNYALRHSPAPAESPRRGSAGPWAPWRPFPDQKVGRRRSGARLFAFLSNDFSFLAPRPSLSFPPRSPKRHDGSLPARKRRSMRPGAHAFLPRPLPYAGAQIQDVFSKSRARAESRSAFCVFTELAFQFLTPRSRSKKSCACASGARLFCVFAKLAFEYFGRPSPLFCPWAEAVCYNNTGGTFLASNSFKPL